MELGDDVHAEGLVKALGLGLDPDPMLVLVELGDDVHTEGLVEAREGTEALLVRRPVERHDGLRLWGSEVEWRASVRVRAGMCWWYNRI